METLAVIAVVAGVALAAWIASAIIWWFVRRLGRATGLDRRVDQFLEVDGDGLSAADRVRFREQHPRGGSP